MNNSEAEDKLKEILNKYNQKYYYNNDYLIEYSKIIKATNLQGRFQVSVGFLMMLIFVTSNFAIMTFSFQKEIPSYECISIIDLDDVDQSFYNVSRYKIIDDYFDPKVKHCMERYCNHTDFNTYFYLNNFSTFSSPSIIKIDMESVDNYLTKFYSDNSFCEAGTFNYMIIVSILLGRILGFVIFPFISEYLGRKYSLLIIITIFISTNIFLLFDNNLEFFLLLMLIYSTTNFISALSSSYLKEMVDDFLFRLIKTKQTIYSCIVSLLYIFIFEKLKSWRFILYSNILLTSIILFLSFKYAEETPFYLLYRRKYYKLRKNVIFISNINLTYELNVEEMIKKIQKQKRFSKELLKIDLEIKLENQSKINYENIKLFLKEFLKNFIYYVRSFSYTFVVTLIPLIVLFSSLNTFYYGQLFYLDKIYEKLKQSNYLNLGYILIFSELMSHLFFCYYFIYDFRKGINKKKFILSSFIIIMILSITMSSDYITNFYLTNMNFFLINFFSFLNLNVLILYLEENYTDNKNVSIINIKSFLYGISSVIFFIINHFLFQGLYFLFSCQFFICTITSLFLFLNKN